MANLGMSFNPEEAEKRSFAELEPGTYAAEVLDTEVKINNGNTGTLLKITWRVTEGPRENSRIWQQMNIQHEKATVQKIGQSQLREVCEALGINGHIEDSEVLHGGQARVVVGMGKASADGKYPARPEVKAVKPYTQEVPAGKAPATAPAQTAQAAKPTQAAAPAATAAKPAGARPWANKANAA